MSEGRWVWVPGGWRVVPPYEDYPMCPTSRDVLEEVFAAAPTPPSGWSRDTPPREEQILVQRFSNGNFEVITAYTRWPKVSYWWTPLPPPPEVKP